MPIPSSAPRMRVRMRLARLDDIGLRGVCRHGIINARMSMRIRIGPISVGSSGRYGIRMGPVSFYGGGRRRQGGGCGSLLVQLAIGATIVLVVKYFVKYWYVAAASGAAAVLGLLLIGVMVEPRARRARSRLKACAHTIDSVKVDGRELCDGARLRADPPPVFVMEYRNVGSAPARAVVARASCGPAEARTTIVGDDDPGTPHTARLRLRPPISGGTHTLIFTIELAKNESARPTKLYRIEFE